MQRDGDRILLEKAEQDIFGLVSTLSVEEALQIAVVFRDVAIGLYSRGAEETRDGRIIVQKAGFGRMLRGAQLGLFALSVFEVCPDEYQSLIAEAAGDASVSDK